MCAPVSVITIVKNRTDKLCNLVNQLEACEAAPSELIIVWMTPPSDLSLIKSDKFTIEHKFANQHELPIAKARNKGMFEAKNETLLYISVDTIFSPKCIEEGLNSLTESSIVRAPVEFIPLSDCESPYEHLFAERKENTEANLNSVTKPNNNVTTSSQKDENHGKFSNDSSTSAMFFIRKTDFEKAGGFDETYDGYGLNDEDFFTQCRALNFSIHDLSLPSYSPARETAQCPVNHLLDFVHNAQLFREKWGYYPRKDILQAYAEKGLINLDFEESAIRVTRLPSDEELNAELNVESDVERDDESVPKSNVPAKRSERATKKPSNAEVSLSAADTRRENNALPSYAPSTIGTPALHGYTLAQWRDYPYLPSSRDF